MNITILRPWEVSNDARRRFFASTLRHWFQRHGRDLPWRRTRDPYKIMISEVMLQQTQVERVKEYYHRFLDIFPTIQDLANASEAEVVEAWAGLGYYNRARNLHKAAIAVVYKHEGKFPETVDELKKLPGIGRYTAGAIVSFAFMKHAPILDTNVRRVLERVFVKRAHSSPAKQDRRLWRLAEEIISPETVWEINQAIMDFGATICTAKSPSCAVCPMQAFCVDYERRKSPQIELEYSFEQPKLAKAAEPYVPYRADSE